MNKTFKVVFNKARGALMVVNEITGTAHKKGTKTVIAVAVAAALSSGVAFAADYEQSEGNSGYSSTSAEEQTKVFAAGEELNMSITGDSTQAYGLLANGAGHTYTNEGTVNVNKASGDNVAKYWKVKGMMADQGGTAVNDGTINVTNAYGMTVGSSKGDGEANTIINNGTITVAGGAGMEAAPTGTAGTVGTAQAVATNNGTISVKNGTGILVAGESGTITNNGTIDAQGQTAVLIQQEEGKTTSNNTITFGSQSVTTGDIAVSGGTGTKLVFENGSAFDGRITVSKGATSEISGQLNINGRSGTTGSAIYVGDANSSIDLVDSNFSNNKVTSSDTYGGAICNYGSPVSLEGGSFSNNSAQSTGANSTNGTVQEGAGGGAVMLKGSPNTIFKDVLFTNNSAVAQKTDETVGGYAYGGAVMVDFSTGNTTGVERASDITFEITKDLTYFGNTVSSDSTAENFDTYGYHVPTAAAGGFLFLDRGSAAVFDIQEGATLTIGQSVTDDDTDSIASSIPNTGTGTNDGKHASIVKTGTGALVINSSLNKYYGTIDVQAGQTTVNSAWDIKNAVTVGQGATLALAQFNVVGAEDSGNQDVSGTAIGGSIAVNGTLQTSSAQVFTGALDAEATVTDAQALKYTADQVSFAESATLALTDAQYNLAYAQSAGNLLQTGKVVMLGSLVGEVENTVTLGDIEEVGENVVLNQVTVDAEDKNIQIGGTPEGDVAYRSESLSVGALDMGTANSVTVSGEKSLTLTGNGGEIIASTANDPITVTVESGSAFNLGGEYAQGGQISGTVNLADATASMTVTGASDFTVDTITGSGTVNVGDEQTAGNLVVNSLEGMTGIIFIDPDWKEGQNSIADASHLTVKSGETLSAGVVAGRNAVATFGGDAAAADAAFEKLASMNGLQWGPDGVTAAFYAAGTVDLGTSGGILVDGSLTATPSEVAHAVTVNKQGMFIVNQAAAETAVVKGDVVLNEGSYLGVSNASVASFDLASGTVTDNGTQVVTDNPFIKGEVSGNKVVGSYDAENGLSALASTGIQAMTRRADMMLAQSVADRTSIDQDYTRGSNLWVDVSGERYEADNLDNNANFKADMGYAVFGADFALTDTVTAGAAIQYGMGSLRSSVSSIKNDIKNYGLALYAGKSFGAAKIVGEVAYLQSENEITSSQTAMNQDVDAKIYSAGVTAQYQLTAGNFQFVPSIGVRVSKLETDSMAIGTVHVNDQDQTLVQVPIALRINGLAQQSAGWTLSPTMRVAYVPTFGDDEIEVLNYNQDVIDTSPVQADFGLRAQKGNWLMNAQMSVGGGKDGASSVGGRVGVKYMF